MAFVFRSLSLVERSDADWLIEVALNKMTYGKRGKIVSSLHFLGFHTIRTIENISLSSFFVRNLSLFSQIVLHRAGTRPPIYASGTNKLAIHFRASTSLDIFSRLIHGKLSFKTAEEECRSLGGQLLLLKNVGHVKTALGNSMVGNVESDYRIDGWSEGEWFEGDNETISKESHSFLDALKYATLTMNLEDGSVSHSRHAEAKLGSVCQGVSGVGKQGCEGKYCL